MSLFGRCRICGKRWDKPYALVTVEPGNPELVVEESERREMLTILAWHIAFAHPAEFQADTKLQQILEAAGIRVGGRRDWDAKGE